MNPSEVYELFSRPERPRHCVLSVYLNVDQSRQANLNRGFENELRDMISYRQLSIHDPAEMESFHRVAHRVTDFVSAYSPGARSLVLFCDESDGFFWHGELQIPIHNQLHWDRELFTQPLANALSQFERYGIVLVDRASFRLFTVFLDEIIETAHKKFDSGRVRHLKTAGTDRIESSSRLQHSADEHIAANLKFVTGKIDELIKEKKADHLILAGTPEITAELEDMLPKRLASLVIGSVSVGIEAPLAAVLAAAKPVAQGYERSVEAQTVKDVTTAAAKHQRAVIGLGHTLKELNSDRVWQLVYSDDFSSPGFECAKCAALFSIANPSCPYCGAAVNPVNDVVERAVEHALRKGARIEAVTGEASAVMAAAGGIGALLKTRTGTLQV